MTAETTTQPTTDRPWDTADDMLEAAMGLISAASDWNSAGLRWEGDTPIPLPPSDSPDSVEWRAVARKWLDAYAEQLSARLSAIHDVACPTHGPRRIDLAGPELMCDECRVVGSDGKPLGWSDGRPTQFAPGEDDAEVWIPPLTDCLDFGYGPCPNCGESLGLHRRTGRCATCGRRVELKAERTGGAE